MTGRELIIEILRQGLENQEVLMTTPGDGIAGNYVQVKNLQEWTHISGNRYILVSDE